MKYEHILYDKKDGVVCLTLNRSEVLNARNAKMRKEIIEACREIRGDGEVRAVILTGAGRAFSVGRDLKEPFERQAIANDRQIRAEEKDAEAVANLDKPVIAAINGFALGGGCELCLACDIRIAAEGARIGLPEVTRALMPGSGGTQRLARLVGKGRALEMLMTGEPVTAEEAFRIGLVNKVVPADQLIEEARRMAQKIAANGPVALRFIKEAVNRGFELSLEDGLRLETDLSLMLRTTEDFEEGRKAFVEKRKPAFKGK